MSRIIQFRAHARPTGFFRQILNHTGDVSEGSTHKILTTRIVAGKKVTFYHNGYRKVHNLKLTEEDTHNSEILRLVHASILTRGPIGKKSYCYVDATYDPVEVWVYGMRLEKFLASSKKVIVSGELDRDFLLDLSLKEISEVHDERNERFFGR